MVYSKNNNKTNNKKRTALEDITAYHASCHPQSNSSSTSSNDNIAPRKRACSDAIKQTISTTSKTAATSFAPLAPSRRRATRHTAAGADTAAAPAATLPPSSSQAQDQQQEQGQAGPDDTSRRLYSTSTTTNTRRRRSTRQHPQQQDQEEDTNSTTTTNKDDLLACDEALDEPLKTFDTPAATAAATVVAAAAAAPTKTAPSTSTHFPASSAALADASITTSCSTSTVPPGILDIDEAFSEASSYGGAHDYNHSGNHMDGNETNMTPQRLAAYSKEYFTYLREREREQQDRSLPDYLVKVQKHGLTQEMRAMLVDWLVTVTSECELMPSTLYHCVELVDRALSLFSIPKEQLQCLGCACLLIACKFEETTVPTLAEFTYMAAESFTKKQLTDLEMRVVEALNFRITTVTAYNFLPRFTLAAGSRPRETALVHYLCELSLLHYEFLAFTPSVRAAAALFLARQTLAAHTADPTRRVAEEKNVWTPTIAYYTGYELTNVELQACIRLLHKVHAGAEWSSYDAFRMKYSESACLHVFEIAALEEEQLGEVFAASC